MQRHSIADIVDVVQSGLMERLAQLEREQAVYGLDALDELALHPVLAEVFRRAGLGVHREVRYPADQQKSRQSQGKRCDFVLTPQRRELAKTRTAWTLFGPVDAVELCDAFWLEVKVVWQFTIGGANPRYSSQLLATVRQDVTKLSKDPGILQAGLLIILFARDEEVAEHDLGVWQDQCLQRGLPIGAPARRTICINDRLGNRCCAIAAYPVSHL